MLRSVRWLTALGLMFSVATSHAAGTAFSDWNSFHQAFAGWALDSTKVANVASLLIERDAGTIVLEQGRLAFAKPLGGRMVAAVFAGHGVLSYQPRSEIERQQLRRFYNSTSLRRPFNRLTMIFSDSTFAELTSTLSFHADTLGQLQRAWLAAFPYLTANHLQFVRPLPVAQMLLDGEENGLFWALATDLRNEDPLFFTLDPNYAERVRLERRPEGDRTGLVRFYNSETVSQGFASGDIDTLRRDMKPAYEATHYALDVTVASDLKLAVTAALDVRAHGVPRAWLGFILPDDLHLDAVEMAGRPQKYFQEPKNPLVWVRLDHAIPADSSGTIQFRYRGESFDRQDDWIYHRYTTAWYPRPWYPADATWDLAFHYPRELQLVAAGERVAFEDRGATMFSRWHVARPVPWASFDLNFLRGTAVDTDSLAPLTVWMRHLDGAGRVDTLSLASMQRAKDYDRHVARDVANCLQFFHTELGAPLATRFNAVETPLWRYEAYPGLIHMMLREDKMRPGAEYTPDVIRAHEISHQWFGLGVAPATYHDAWLSEGFADFCSIWYLQAGRHDSRSYLDVLESWRRKLLENRKFLLGDGQQAGPIWLGQRTNSSATPSDYDLVVYAKGAWVLHMLRNYLLADGEPDETRFRGLMRDFYARYVGHRAFTEDFRAAVERAAGEDMGWFFDQWVYGTDVPTYSFSWKAEPADGGKWRITGHVDQSNVPDTFHMPVLVRVNFGADRYSRQRVMVSGPSCDFTLPLSPIKPTEVVFNDLESVLCEVRR